MHLSNKYLATAVVSKTYAMRLAAAAGEVIA